MAKRKGNSYMNITLEQARALLSTHVRTPNLLKHMRATEEFMKALARKFSENEEQWGIAGLLHDIDYEEVKDPKQHSLRGYEILKTAGVDEEICNAVRIHNPEHGILPVTLLDKALLCGETYTGFVVACSLVMPEKKLSQVTVESAMKKFRTKSFAAGANREIMAQSEPLLSLTIEEMLEICLTAMQGIATELGL